MNVATISGDPRTDAALRSLASIVQGIARRRVRDAETLPDATSTPETPESDAIIPASEAAIGQ